MVYEGENSANITIVINIYGLPRACCSYKGG